jgi:hypothetical protein
MAATVRDLSQEFQEFRRTLFEEFLLISCPPVQDF